ncbi:MAG: MFS transporter [Patescibacteria group bacterium]
MKNKKPTIQKGRNQALILATIILTVNFWAWSLLGPLATKYSTIFDLSPIKVSILISVPVIVGALGRILLGALTDKLGGKKVFTAVCFLASAPVFLLAFANSYNQLLVFGFLLGLGGAIFSVGIPFVNAWFPPEKRGFALGVYGIGNLGVAISGFLSPRLANNLGLKWPFFVVGIVLIMSGLVALVKLRDSAEWKPSNKSFFKSFIEALKLRTTQDLALIYALSFGAFVAFGLYLPVLLKTVYSLSLTDAASRAAGFVIVATLARPVGGWLSDKIGGEKVVKFVLFSAAVIAGLLSFQQPLGPIVTAQYLGLAAILGIGNGAVFALVSKLSPPKLLGSVAGVVGAAGGLGGLLPPLIMGISYQYTKSYSLAISLFSIAAILAFLYITSSKSQIK